MTISQLAACISVLAALVAISGAVMAYRARRAAERTLPTGHGVITFPNQMSDAEVAAFKARWQARYGQPGTPPRGPAGASSANAKRSNDEEGTSA